MKVILMKFHFQLMLNNYLQNGLPITKLNLLLLLMLKIQERTHINVLLSVDHKDGESTSTGSKVHGLSSIRKSSMMDTIWSLDIQVLEQLPLLDFWPDSTQLHLTLNGSMEPFKLKILDISSTTELFIDWEESPIKVSSELLMEWKAHILLFHGIRLNT